MAGLKVSSGAVASVVISGALIALAPREPPPASVLSGRRAMGDWTTDAPGVRRKITVADLPPPYATASAENDARIVKRPDGAWPKAPAGFKVEEFLSGLDNPRLIRTAPNGDIFLAESGPGRIRVLRAADGAAKPELNSVFASGLDRPFGIAFYPPGPDPRYVYVGETGAVVRFAYQKGDVKARGRKEVVVGDIPSGGRLRGGGHWTRDVAFSSDGRKMFVSVGSRSNDHENPSVNEERPRRHPGVQPGRDRRAHLCSGIRNAVGIAVHPATGELWASVNERDGLGDDLVPDYVTRVKEGGFYGWPWYYMGSIQDPRHRGEHPELRGESLVPDVLLQSHSASLEMAFYTGRQFPAEYRNDAFAAEHGSWNRSRRTGYKVIRVPLHDGVPTGEYEDFLTGFVTPAGDVWGRPVGVTVARDGSLLVSDDGGERVWRVSYKP